MAGSLKSNFKPIPPALYGPSLFRLCGNRSAEKLNANYNAAVNIARSDKIVKKKEDCEYYKLKQSKRGVDLNKVSN